MSKRNIIAEKETIQRKMDGIMRQLLEMDDKTIRKRIRQDQRRLQRLKENIQRDVNHALPQMKRQDETNVSSSKTSDSTTIMRNHLIRMRQSELFPDPIVAVVIRDSLRRIRIRAITNFTGNRNDLESLGLHVRSQAQDMFTVVGTPQQLRDLAAQGACQRLRAPRMFFPTVENASAQAEIADVHNPRPINPTGYEGNGVLIGIIDSALEVTHNTFRDPNGHGTRLLYYWVQEPYTRNSTSGPNFGDYIWPTLATLPGQSPDAWSRAGQPGTRPNWTGLTDGRLYTQADIDAAIGSATHYGTGNNQICCEPWYHVYPSWVDTEHGTHCAGIAAGNGHELNWNTTPTHVGAAPQASLVYVRTRLLSADVNRDGTWEDAILDGINFCLEAARFHNNMPIVISISQGNNLGPHNGSSDLDLAIDNLLNSFFNRSVVIAAGNDNDNNSHLNGTIQPNTTTNFTITSNVNRLIYLDIWYSGPELDYRINYNGANSGWLTATQPYNGTLSSHHIQAMRDADLGGGLRNIRMFFEDAFTGCSYTIELRNPNTNQSADFHAWTGSQGQWATVSGALPNNNTLADTACCKSILTVGACLKTTPANPASGEQIIDFSGAGPTLDGRIKPEIVAVGDSVTSASSDQSNGWEQMSGTSMATPLTAGAVALLFDAYRRPPLSLQLNQDTIKALLVQNTNRLNLNLDPLQPGYSVTQRNRYGNGRLRVIDAIDLSLPNPADVDVWIRTASDDYGEEPFKGDCFCCSPDIRVCEAGTNNEVTQLSWGTKYDVKVTVRNLGDSDAVGTKVRLLYTTPHTAPNSWFVAEDDNDNKLEKTVTVPAMNQTEVTFNWRPEASEIGAPASQTHFCMLAELDHLLDPLVFSAPTSGGSAWATNIKGTNNIALRNLNIQ